MDGENNGSKPYEQIHDLGGRFPYKAILLMAEIRLTTWDGAETLWIMGFQLPTSTGELIPDFRGPINSMSRKSMHSSNVSPSFLAYSRMLWGEEWNPHDGPQKAKPSYNPGQQPRMVGFSKGYLFCKDSLDALGNTLISWKISDEIFWNIFYIFFSPRWALFRFRLPDMKGIILWMHVACW